MLIPQGGLPLEQLWDPERYEPPDDLSKLELEPYANYLEVTGRCRRGLGLGQHG